MGRLLALLKLKRKKSLETLLPDELWVDIFEKSSEVPAIDIDPDTLSAQAPEIRRPSPWHWSNIQRAIKTRRNIVLVCKRWYRIGIPVLWSHLIIWRGQNANDESPLIPEELLNTLHSNWSRLRYISCLTLLNEGQDKDEYDRHDERCQVVLKQISNLHTIRCKGGLLPRLGETFADGRIRRLYTDFSGNQTVQVPCIRHSNTLTYLDIHNPACTSLIFQHEQQYPQLITLRVCCDVESSNPKYIGTFIIAPRLRNLFISGFKEKWNLSCFPRECLRSLRVLEVVGTCVDAEPIEPNSVDELPLLHTLRVNVPSPFPMEAIRCPQLQNFHLIPPFFTVGLHGQIDVAIRSFPSIINAKIYHDQFCKNTPVERLFKSYSDRISRWTPEGPTISFDPPLLPSSHPHDRVLCLAEEYKRSDLCRIKYGYFKADKSFGRTRWYAWCRVDGLDTGWTEAYLSREDARNAAAVRMAELLEARGPKISAVYCWGPLPDDW